MGRLQFLKVDCETMVRTLGSRVEYLANIKRH